MITVDPSGSGAWAMLAMPRQAQVSCPVACQTDKAFSTPSQRMTGGLPGSRTAEVADQSSRALFVRFCTLSGALRPSSVT